MCVPGCHDSIVKRLSRRSFFKQAAAVGAASAIGCASSTSPKPSRAGNEKVVTSFSEVVDLTYSLSKDFPTYLGGPALSMKTLTTVAKDGYHVNEITFIEHVGTHIDAPIHFSATGMPVNEIPVSQLVAPLAVIDIREKAASNADAQLTPEDIKAYEAKHGPLPQGACVAMNSGWGAHVGSKKFRNADGKGTMHFPGFHVEAAKMLTEERSVLGIAVDTLSLDYGQSKDFATHYHWLPASRWGIENLANLDSVPAAGATIVVGAPSWVNGSGGPSRIFALV